IKGGVHCQQLSTNCSDCGIQMTCIDKTLNEIRKQQNIRIQCQHPFSTGKMNGLILSGRKSDVLVVVDNATTVLEHLKNVDCAVGRTVINHNNFKMRIFLGKS